jgi:acetyltransferase-like isoleucine patch superfamily enzyme
VLRELLGSLGEGSEIRPPLRCDYGYQTHVGARTFINFGVVLLTRDLPANVVAVGNPARVVRPL